MGPCVRRNDMEYAALLAVTPPLDFLDQPARRRLPAEFSPRALGTDAAVGGHGIFGGALAPFGGGLLQGHRCGLAGEAEHSVDGEARLAHRVLTILDEVEGAGRRLVDRQRVERDEIVDMHVGPDVLPWTGMRCVAALPGQ